MSDPHLPADPAAATALRTALTQERARRQELEQELARLRAGLERQNTVIADLHREQAQLREQLAAQQAVLTAVMEQNALLRQQVATLEAENRRLRGEVPPPRHQATPWPSETTKQTQEPTPRKKRAPEHNKGPKRLASTTPDVIHAVDACPQCGTVLTGGWVQRRVQVIELPPPVTAMVTDHVLLARRCPGCRKTVVPPAPGAAAGRIGRCRFGPRLVSAIAIMHTIERLPGRQIQARLEREYGLHLSHGGIVGLTQLAARRATPYYEGLKEAVRGSPVVHGDETGWRQDGVPGYIWTFSTPTVCYFHYDAHRSKDLIDQVVGEDFAGTMVSDCYAAYDHLLGPKQRCWSHLWRNIEEIELAHPDDERLAAWIAGIHRIYTAATGPRPSAEVGDTADAIRAREQRARRYELQVLALCPEDMAADRPEATLAKRLRHYSQELFTFVRDPLVPATNNSAERSLRPLVIARKISGGTRSETGSTTRMVLASMFATARLQGQQPAAVCQQILLGSAPPPAPTI